MHLRTIRSKLFSNCFKFIQLSRASLARLRPFECHSARRLWLWRWYKHPCQHVSHLTLNSRSPTKCLFVIIILPKRFWRWSITGLRLWLCGAIIIVSLQALYIVLLSFFTHSGHVFICSRHVIYGRPVRGSQLYWGIHVLQKDPAHLTLKRFYYPANGKRCRNCCGLNLICVYFDAVIWIGIW